MKRFQLKLPGVSPAVNQVIVHYSMVFLLAFGTQLVAGTTGKVHVSSLLALLTSAGAAGLAAVVHVVLGLIPTPPTTQGLVPNAVGISLKVKTEAYQFITSVVVMFLSIFGAQLVSGVVGITSLPDVIAVVLAAIAAAVTGIVQYFVSLVPAPKA